MNNKKFHRFSNYDENADKRLSNAQHDWLIYRGYGFANFWGAIIINLPLALFLLSMLTMPMI
jgi:hypothetical protein